MLQTVCSFTSIACGVECQAVHPHWEADATGIQHLEESPGHRGLEREGGTRGLHSPRKGAEVTSASCLSSFDDTPPKGLRDASQTRIGSEPSLLLRRNGTEPSCGGKGTHRFQVKTFIGFYMTSAGVNTSAYYCTLDSSHTVGQHFKVVSKCLQQSILVPLTHLPQVIILTT